ncbi:MAG: DUF2442 domain-containing protein [Clostridiales Family XIII bacterium]|jgi:hypothetical protein|nr:DUF2442 domain-containing protein [Clostridiales Family XIII bacterium]
MEYKHPAEVTPLDNYMLRIVFEGGEERVFDVKPYLAHPFFAPLREVSIFATAHISHGTVVWGSDIDMGPDDLYFNSTPAA